MRQQGEHADLDIARTIDSTVRSGGFVAFQYYLRKSPPEYLVLIERSSARDHWAKLSDFLVQAFQHEGIFIERFFFENDPRECWSETSLQPMSLVDLRLRYPAHRLLIFGDGAALLDPVSGELASWTSVFSSWKERALLTLAPVLQWSLRERRLAAQFLVVPADIEGLHALGEYFGANRSYDPQWLAQNSNAPAPKTLTELRTSLGPDAFVWLCACAVHPELHWDLTLHIACLSSMPGGLLTENNVLNLLRLPWFRAGFMPDDLRRDLLRELKPVCEREVRLAIIEILGRTPAPVGTIAADRQRMEIVLQRYFLGRQNGTSVRRLMKTLQNSPGDIRRDYVALRLTELPKPTPLDFLLPLVLRKRLFAEGLSLLGLRSVARVCVTAAVIALLLYGFRRTDLFRYDAALAPHSAPTHQSPILVDKTAPVENPAPDFRPSPSMARQLGRNFGTVLVRAAVAGARVYVDNIASGFTDVDGNLQLSLPAELHYIRVEKTGYEAPSSQSVRIGENANKVLLFALPPEKARLELHGAPAGIELRINGVIVAETDGSAMFLTRVPPGARVQLAAKDGMPIDLNSTFNPGDTVTLNWTSLAPPNTSAAVIPATPVPPPAAAPVSRPDPADIAWTQVIAASDPASVQAYLRAFPTSLHAPEAQSRLDSLLWARVDRSDSESIRSYMTAEPAGTHVGEAQLILDQLGNRETERDRASSDKAAVRDLVSRYAAAYTSRDAAQVRLLYPDVPKFDAIRQFFRSTPSVQVTITPEQDPAISGDIALIKCRRTTLITDERGQRVSHTDRIIVRCRRGNGQWLIQSVGPT